jgi:hypothetical protein
VLCNAVANRVMRKEGTMRRAIWIGAFLMAGCGHRAAYAPASASGNQCDNECTGTARSCQAAGGKDACIDDLEACRANCFKFHGGDWTPKTFGFWEKAPTEHKEPPGTAPAGQPAKGGAAK